jgi:hypothetical protein
MPNRQQRRAARKRGISNARKSRWRANTVDNHGGFMLVNPYTNCVVDGPHFDMSAAEVITASREKVQ